MNDPASPPDPWTPTTIRGVFRRALQAHADERGSFTELWRESWTSGVTSRSFRQANLSRSRARVLRGMHFHARQSDLWLVADGAAVVAVADLRGMVEAATARPQVETLELAAGDAILIPELVAHGFYARTDLTLIYLVTNEFDGSDELGFHWADPDAAIPWPDSDPIVSERDRSNPDIRTALGQLDQAGASSSA